MAENLIILITYNINNFNGVNKCPRSNEIWSADT
jgi:hypothetical protein